MNFQNFYHIDKIAWQSAEGLVGDTFKMNVGNAVFLIDEIEKELKRMNRANGKTKCPHLGNWSESYIIPFTCFFFLDILVSILALYHSYHSKLLALINNKIICIV